MDRMIKHSRSAPELMAIAHDDVAANADAAPKRVCLRRSISQCSSLSSLLKAALLLWGGMRLQMRRIWCGC